jgi:hypothetical protein
LPDFDYQNPIGLSLSNALEKRLCGLANLSALRSTPTRRRFPIVSITDVNDGYRFRLTLPGSPSFALGSLLSATGAPTKKSSI